MFERIVALLELAKQFRREVSETYAPLLAEIDLGDEKARLQFLKAIQFSIVQVSAEVHNQGFGNPDTLPDSFDERQRSRIRQLQSHWNLCRGELDRVINAGISGVRPSEILNPMRAINLTFLRLALERLQQLAAAFQIPGLGDSRSPYRNWIPADMLPPTQENEQMPMQHHADMPVPTKALRATRSIRRKSIKPKVRSAQRD